MGELEGPTDKQVIRNIKKGNIGDFSYIVNRYSKQMVQYVKKRLFNAHDIDDVVQESFLSLYKAMNRFDETKPVAPYLYMIVKNQLKMYYRAHKATVALPENIQLEDNYKESDIHDEVNRYLEKLPDQQKKALYLIGEGFSYQEIAHQLHKPLNTVRTLIHRARAHINTLRNTYEKA